MGRYDKIDYYVACILDDELHDDTAEDNLADAEMVYEYWCKEHPTAWVFIKQRDTGRIIDERLATAL
jgi:hypothetical protein